MKRFKVVIVSFAVFTVICGSALAARADDQQTIADLERKLVVTTNVDELMKFWDSSDDVVVFDVMGPPREFVGQKALRDHFADFSGYKDVKADFLELKVISDGKLALASTVQHYTAKDADGKPIDDTYRQTDLWRKTNGQWKLINSHASFPVDLKTGKADMASKM